MTAVTKAAGSAARLTTEVLNEFRTALEEQRAFRREQLDELMAPRSGEPAPAMDDPRDEVAETLRNGAMSALTDIEAALARIRSGSYGNCETCRRTIPLERLEVLPMAALCIRCAHARQHRPR
jgi:RNA polymerase-binding transcription factor DksA